jgi:hypothetical protein
MKGITYNLTILKNNKVIENLNMDELIKEIKNSLAEDNSPLFINNLKLNNQIIFNLIKEGRPVNKILKYSFSISKNPFKKNILEKENI